MGFLKEITDSSGKPKYPVLVLTARANMAEFFADMEVDGFIAKPCDPADLLMEVGRVIFLRSGPEEEQASEGAVGGKVLIAEDDGARNQILVGAFKETGFDVCSVTKGPEVLEQAIVEKPDVIVLKLVMSSMNGDAIAGVLKDMPNTKSIPIVLYDDTGADIPESKFLEGGTGIKKFVRSNEPQGIIDAVKSLL